jgi:hypothetical protein
LCNKNGDIAYCSKFIIGGIDMACFFHKWNGCKCEKCGKIRNEGHNWNLCEGECSVCGKSHIIRHEWDGCKCKNCGIEGGHDWNYSCKGKTCTICGKKDEFKSPCDYKVYSDKCYLRCDVCGKMEFNYSEEVHHFTSIENCQKRCKKCGAIAYDHDYKFVCDSGHRDEYKCSKCGHNGYQNKRRESYGTWEYGGMHESGIIEKQIEQ